MKKTPEPIKIAINDGILISFLLENYETKISMSDWLKKTDLDALIKKFEKVDE